MVLGIPNVLPTTTIKHSMCMAVVSFPALSHTTKMQSFQTAETIWWGHLENSISILGLQVLGSSNGLQKRPTDGLSFHLSFLVWRKRTLCR